MHQLGRLVPSLLPSVLCLDVGASYYPHPAWELFRRSARTTWLAVEPNVKNTGYLDEWHWPSKAQLVGTGLSEHGGEQTLHVTNVDSGSSLLPPHISTSMAHRVPDRGYFYPVTEKRILTRTLSDVIASAPELAPDTPIVLKLDTQGTELSILRGAERYFAEGRVLGVETEATLLAEPLMAGSGKFADVCQFLEARGFELLQLKPIEASSMYPAARLQGRFHLNECDAVFCIRPELLRARPVEHRLAALGFYLSYQLYDEARHIWEQLEDKAGLCARAAVSEPQLRELLFG